MSEADVPSVIAQRIFIKFLSNEYVISSLTRNRYYRHKLFCGVCSLISQMEENTRRVCNRIRGDPCILMRKMAATSSYALK